MSGIKIKQALKDFGLSQKETEIYISLAKHGALTGGEISKLTKTHRPTIYRILKNLQKKGAAESTLESPTRYIAIPFETILESNIQTKREEVTKIEKAKTDLLNDWKSIRKTSIELHLDKFVVIEGRHRIYQKILKMLDRTKEQLSIILDVSDLAQVDQFNLFETLDRKPNKSRIGFRIITQLTQQDFDLAKALLKRTPNLGINLKVRNPELGLTNSPRMIVRDNKEVLLFISSGTNFPSAKKDEVCLWTNCQTLVQTFNSVFIELWENSTDIKQKMLEIETGKPSPTTHFIKNSETAIEKYEEILGGAQKEIMIVTSSKGLLDYWNQASSLKKLVENGVSVEIMAPISSENLKTALQLSEFCKVRHVPKEYNNITIIDDKHLFQFTTIESHRKEENVRKKQETFYSNEFEYIKKTKNMLTEIWKNSVEPSSITLDSILDYSTRSTKKPEIKNSKFLFADKVVTSDDFCDETLERTITEQDVINKILNLKRESPENNKKIIRLYATFGAAIIRPHKNFNLPDTLIEITKIDEESSFGAENALRIHQWLKTPKGYRYVPVAIIADNPKASVIWKKLVEGTPAEKNYHLITKDELQIQIHGDTLFAGWTIPIPLPNQKPIPPSVLILEAIGKVRTRVFSQQHPINNAKSITECNCFDAFITFIHQQVKYKGPATDALFARELYNEVHLTQPPEHQ